MYSIQVPTLREVCVVKLTEILWLEKSIVNSFHKILPNPTSGRDVRKEDIQEITKEVRNHLSELEVPVSIQSEMQEIVEPISWQIIDWINELNYEFYGCRDHYELYSKSYFLQQLSWTIRGTIDKKASVYNILHNEKLSVSKRYELACTFCWDELASQFYSKLQPNQKSIYLTGQGTDNLDLSGDDINPLFVYWTFLLEGQIAKIVTWEEDGKNINEYLALWAIRNNKHVAFHYFWENLTEAEKMKNIIKFAETSSIFISMNPYARGALIKRKKQFPYINDFAQLNANILAFLLPQLLEDQLTELLLLNSYHFLMSFFLHWLWHDNFIRTVTRWECLTEVEVEALLLGIVGRQPSSYEAKRFNKGLEIVINKNVLIFKEIVLIKNCQIFWKLFAMKDSSVLKLVLKVLGVSDKAKIITSNVGIVRCRDLIMKGEFEYLDVFLEGALLFEEDKYNFRRHLFQAKDSLCNYLLLENKYDLFMQFVKWSQVTEEEIENFKFELIDEGQLYFIVKVLLVNHSSLEAVDNFVSWCYNSCEESIVEFKAELIENETAVGFCAQLVNREKFDLAKEFLRWCGYALHKIDGVVEELLNEFVHTVHYHD